MKENDICVFLKTEEKKLMTVCNKLDDYCEKIGIDLDNEDVSLKDHVSIYSEPWNAINNTREAIEKALNDK